MHKRNNSATDNFRVVDAGNLHCLSENDDNPPGNALHFTTLEGAENLAKTSCDAWINSKLQLIGSTQGLMPSMINPPVVDDSDPHFSRLVVTVGHAKTQRCATPIDFTASNMKALCIKRLYTVINGCDLKKNGNDFWKQGGMYYKDCTTWTLSKLNVITQES